MASDAELCGVFDASMQRQSAYYLAWSFSSLHRSSKLDLARLHSADGLLNPIPSAYKNEAKNIRLKIIITRNK